MGRKKVRPVSENDFGLIEEKNEVDGAQEKKFLDKKSDPDANEKGKNAMKSDENKPKGKKIPNKVSEKKSTQKSSALGSRNDGVGKEERAEKRGDERAKTPAKRKRSADEKMAEAFLSSPELPSSRLRTRKQVPSFQKVFLGESDFNRIVGKRVRVFWSGSRRWFIGRVRTYDAKKNLHEILYDDGDKEELNLLEERFELEVMPEEVFSGSPKPNKKETSADGGEIDEGTVKDDAGEEKQARSNKNLVSKLNKGKSKKQDDNDSEKTVDVDTEVDALPKKDEEKALNEEFGRFPKPKKKKMSSDGGKIDEEADKDNAVDKEQAKMKRKMASKFAKKGGSKKLHNNDTEKENVDVDMEADALPKKDEEKVLSEEFSQSPKPKKKEGGSDGGKTDEEVEKENVGEKKPAKTNRKVTFKVPKKGSSSQHNKNDTKKEVENVGVGMEVDALPKKDEEKVLSEELGLSSKLKKKETGSDGVEVDEETEKENAGEKKRGRMNKKVALKVAKKGSSNQQNKNGAEKEAESVGMDMEVDALSKEDEDKVLSEEFSQSPKPKKEETGSDGVEIDEEGEKEKAGEKKQAKVNKKLALKVAKKGSANQQNKNDTEEKVENIGIDIEVDAPPKKDDGKAFECSQVEKPGGSRAGKVNGEIDEALGDGNGSKPENHIQVGKTEILDSEKQKMENGEVSEDKAEEKESGEKNILEGVSKMDSALDLEPTTDNQSMKDEGQRSLASGSLSTESSDSQTPADEQAKNGEGQDVESVKNPVKTGKAKTKAKN